MNTIVLQNGALDCYTGAGSGPDMLGCVAADLFAAVGGQAVFGLLIGGALIAALYFAGGGHPAAPTVGTVLLGSALVPVLPAAYAKLAYSILVLGLAFGVMSFGRTYVFEGGGF